MKRLLPIVLLMFLPHLAPAASAQCAGVEDLRAAFVRADFVFSGRVVWLDPILARIQVDRIWKGEERSEIVVRTGDLVTESGFRSFSEKLSYSIGQQYVLYASGPLDQLTVPGCRRSGVLSDQEVAALDAITPHKKISTEVHRCAGAYSDAAGEVRVTMSSSSEVALRGARVTADSATVHNGLLSGDGGHVVFTGLQPGEFKITVDASGFTPKQITVNVPEKSCFEAALFLSPTK